MRLNISHDKEENKRDFPDVEYKLGIDKHITMVKIPFWK